VPQASIVNISIETSGLPRYYKPKSYFFIDTKPNKGIYIKLWAEGISEYNYS
jgi:hypothetical protein